ncbi:MAG: hypothetical protein ACK5IQ_03025 [Bacteroidales bacterium]
MWESGNEIISIVDDDYVKPQTTSSEHNQTERLNRDIEVEAMSEDAIIYAVQISAVPYKSLFTNPLNKEIDVWSIKVKNNYKILAGKFESYEQALQSKNDINKTIPDAFVVAVRGGETIALSKAKSILGK